jgi:hypothetical protein
MEIMIGTIISRIPYQLRDYTPREDAAAMLLHTFKVPL